MKSAKDSKFLLSIYLSFWIYFAVYFALKYFIYSHSHSKSELFHNHNHFNFEQDIFIVLAPFLMLISIYLISVFKRINTKFIQKLGFIIFSNLTLNSLSYVLLGITDLVLLSANLLATSAFIFHFEYRNNQKKEILKTSSNSFMIFLLSQVVFIYATQITNDFEFSFQSVLTVLVLSLISLAVISLLSRIFGWSLGRFSVFYRDDA